MRKTLVLLAAFCALSGFEQPQEEQLSEVVEKWRCVNDSDWSSQERTDAGYDDIPENEWIVTLTRGMLKHSKAAFGTVSVTGITHRAIFSVKGLERRWDFGENSEGEYGYAFVIDSQGGGAYYDFSGSETGEIVWPSQTYHCLLKRNLEEARRLVEKAEAARRQLEETERKRREAEVAEQLRSEMSESDALPIVRIEPQWPREALMDGTEGYVRFRVLIGTDGSVVDTEVIEAAPGRLFVRNATRAVRRWKFKPRVVDGTPVERWATTTIVFNLEG